jgi:hypothetical protein
MNDKSQLDDILNTFVPINLCLLIRQYTNDIKYIGTKMINKKPYVKDDTKLYRLYNDILYSVCCISSRGMSNTNNKRIDLMSSREKIPETIYIYVHDIFKHELIYSKEYKGSLEYILFTKEYQKYAYVSKIYVHANILFVSKYLRSKITTIYVYDLLSTNCWKMCIHSTTDIMLIDITDAIYTCSNESSFINIKVIPLNETTDNFQLNVINMNMNIIKNTIEYKNISTNENIGNIIRIPANEIMYMTYTNNNNIVLCICYNAYPYIIKEKYIFDYKFSYLISVNISKMQISILFEMQQDINSINSIILNTYDRTTQILTSSEILCKADVFNNAILSEDSILIFADNEAITYKRILE